MSDTKFTQGEWFVQESAAGSFEVSIGRNGWRDSEYLCVSIQTQEDSWHAIIERANAHIIAQSPNLYHALGESTQCMEIMLDSLERQGYDTSGIEIQLEKNKAVLSAARGE